MTEKILILDFGSQYTQLIARTVREANVYCEIIPYNKEIIYEPGLRGIILGGSPFSVNEEKALIVDVKTMAEKVPVLGICYGAQLTAKIYGGRVDKSEKREYGRAIFTKIKEDALLQNIAASSQVWMSHADTIIQLPEGFELLGTTENIPIAAFKQKPPPPPEGGTSVDFSESAKQQTTNYQHSLYGLQFHPEVYHSAEGKTIIKNFLVNICGCSQD